MEIKTNLNTPDEMIIKVIPLYEERSKEEKGLGKIRFDATFIYSGSQRTDD